MTSWCLSLPPIMPWRRSRLSPAPTSRASTSSPTPEPPNQTESSHGYSDHRTRTPPGSKRSSCPKPSSRWSPRDWAPRCWPAGPSRTPLRRSGYQQAASAKRASRFRGMPSTAVTMRTPELLPNCSSRGAPSAVRSCSYNPGMAYQYRRPPARGARHVSARLHRTDHGGSSVR